MRSLGIRQVLDIGANQGQYAQEIRRDGFDGVIHSFEPTAEAFSVLKLLSESNHMWFCHNIALGDKNEERIIHVSSDSVSSSILPVGEKLLEVAPQAQQVKEELIQMQTLATWADANSIDVDGGWVKIDVQGFEKNVILGCGSLINKVRALEIECSLSPVYEGEEDLFGIMKIMMELGFQITSIGTGSVHIGTGRVLQVDAIFEKMER